MYTLVLGQMFENIVMKGHNEMPPISTTLFKLILTVLG